MMRFPKQLLKSMYTKENTSHRIQMHACGPSTLRTEMRALQTRQRARRRRCPSDKHSVSPCNAYMLMDDLVAQFQSQSVSTAHTVPFVAAQTLRTCIGFANGLSHSMNIEHILLYLDATCANPRKIELCSHKHAGTKKTNTWLCRPVRRAHEFPLYNRTHPDRGAFVQPQPHPPSLSLIPFHRSI